MEEIDFDITLRTKELFLFTLRHTYFSISGVFSLIISLGSLFICLVEFQDFQAATIMALLFIASLFTVIQPLMLYIKCRMQIKKSDNINSSLHYTLSDQGITVRQNEQEAAVKWYDIRKVVQAKQGLYLYMSPVRAFIFPKEQCGSQYENIRSAVLEQMEKHQDDLPEENSTEE
ncbi:MAG: YcxB family protein [Lachnospiraceae bacterium]|jgi:hypothetical protein|nr:YcxB family protein [Lachnospiraceae bacterium]